MLSHKNLVANARSASAMIDVEPGAVFLSILPMSHTYEFTLGFILPLSWGARIAYAGKTPTPAVLQRICSQEKPYAIFAVPLVLEKIYKKRVLPQISKSFALSLICRFEAGKKFIHKRIGAKLLEFFGGNLQLMGIGGAALNPEVEQFLYNAGFPYLIGYGLTECAPLLAGGPPGDKTTLFRTGSESRSRTTALEWNRRSADASSNHSLPPNHPARARDWGFRCRISSSPRGMMAAWKWSLRRE